VANPETFGYTLVYIIVCYYIVICVGELVTLKRIIRNIRDKNISFHGRKMHGGPCYVTYASGLENAITGVRVDENVLSLNMLNCQYVYFLYGKSFLCWRNIWDSLKMNIIII
jgi:hypothetical protein